ncbi:TPA: MDR family MFS transporter [Bacillus cereus]
MDYFHPLVWQLLGGTIFARTASFMTIPFLAIYLQNDLNASPIMIGLAVGISQLTATFGGFFGGFFTDRFGRKKIIIISMFCWSIVFYGFAFANSVWIFVLCNALNGICRAFFEPASQALMIDYTDEDKRRRLFSIRYTVINLSAVIGPLLGVFISKASSMSFPFLITATMYLLYAIFLVITLRRIEEQNTVNVTQGIGGLLRVLLQDSTLMLLIIASVICNFVYMQTESTMPQLLNLTMADGVALYSVLIAINAATILILQLPLGILSEKVAIKTSLIFGGGLLALGMLIFHFADNWTLFIVGMVVFSLGEIFVFPMMSAIVEMIAPAHQKATYLGVMQFQNLGGFLGPVLGGWLIIHFAPQLYLLMVGLCLVVIVCYIAALRGKSFRIVK